MADRGPLPTINIVGGEPWAQLEAHPELLGDYAQQHYPVRFSVAPTTY